MRIGGVGRRVRVLGHRLAQGAVEPVRSDDDVRRQHLAALERHAPLRGVRVDDARGEAQRRARGDGVLAQHVVQVLVLQEEKVRGEVAHELLAHAQEADRRARGAVREEEAVALVRALRERGGEPPLEEEARHVRRGPARGERGVRVRRGGGEHALDAALALRAGVSGGCM